MQIVNQATGKLIMVSKRTSTLLVLAIGLIGSMSFGAMSVILRLYQGKYLENELERFATNIVAPNSIAFSITIALMMAIGIIRSNKSDVFEMTKAYSLSKVLSIVWASLMLAGLVLFQAATNYQIIKVVAGMMILISAAVVLLQIAVVYMSIRETIKSGIFKTLLLMAVSFFPILIASSVWGKLSEKEMIQLDMKEIEYEQQE